MLMMTKIQILLTISLILSNTMMKMTTMREVHPPTPPCVVLKTNKQKYCVEIVFGDFLRFLWNCDCQRRRRCCYLPNLECIAFFAYDCSLVANETNHIWIFISKSSTQCDRCSNPLILSSVVFMVVEPNVDDNTMRGSFYFFFLSFFQNIPYDFCRSIRDMTFQ